MDFVGLTNTQNECYLNSCIQPLVNTYEFADYFLQGKHKEYLDKVNHSPFSSKGELPKKFAELVTRMLWGRKTK